MNARIVFLFGLVFTVLNVVMAFTTHGGLFIMATLGLIITLGSANYMWTQAHGGITEKDIAGIDWNESWSDNDTAPCGAEESMAGHTFVD